MHTCSTAVYRQLSELSPHFFCIGTIAKLEAACVSNKGIIVGLRSELASVQDRLKLVQEEREGLESSQLNLEKNQTARIAALERVSTMLSF